MSPSFSDLQIEGRSERPIEILDSFRGQMADIPSQQAFRQTNQFVAIDTGIVLQAFVNAHWRLSAKTVPDCIDRLANHRGETGVDERLAADNNESSLLSGVKRVPSFYQIKFTSEHLVPGRLVGKDVVRLGVQFVRVSVDDRDIAVPAPFMGGPIQIRSYCAFQKPRPVRIGLIDLGQQFFREQN
jgi:hypothetical protein